MDDKIWSRLPTELLLPIIQCAIASYRNVKERNASWQKWLTVVRGNSFLHKALLRQQWGMLELSWQDLLLDPDEDEAELQRDAPDLESHHFKNLRALLELNKPADVGRKMLQMDNGMCPGNFVQTFSLQLYQSIDIRENCAPISHRMIRHTLGLMLPALKRIKMVNVEGPPSMVTFEALSKYGSRTIQTLHVGSQWCDYNYITTPGDEYLNRYDWTKLSNLTVLTELMGLQFTEEETRSLHRLIKGLPSLRVLGLAPRRTDMDSRFNRQGRQSPFQKLLGSEEAVVEGDLNSDSTLLPNLLAGLPSTLRSLLLQDPFHEGAFRLRIPAPPRDKDFDLSKCVLDEILTELDDLESTNNALKWLTNAKLTKVTYSPVMSADTPADFNGLGECLDSINDIVSRNQDFLTEITMTNAWKMPQNFADHFATSWADRFRISEVILSTDCKRSLECSLNHKERQKQDLKHFLFGCSENVNRWGSEIKRIRLQLPSSPHDIDLEAEDLMSYPSLNKLKVLIIGSRSTCRAGETDEKKHREIAEALLAHAPDILRLIRLCRFAYWVEHDNSDAQEANKQQKDIQSTTSRRRLVPLSQVLAGNYDSTKSNVTPNNDIRAWLSTHDREFINDNSGTHRQRSSLSRRVPQSELIQYWLQPFNLLVARTTDSEN